MTNIKKSLIDRMSESERKTFSEFVKEFPLDGHEPENFHSDSILTDGVLDNDGCDDNQTLSIISGGLEEEEVVFKFNLATLLALAKFGFEEGLKQ